MTGPSDPEGSISAGAYRRMAWVLGTGIAAAALVLAVALVDFLRRHPGASFSSFLTNNPIQNYLTFSGLITGIEQGHSQALLTLGILILVATPLARVATGAYYFHRAGDRTLARIALTVLALLLVGTLILGPVLH
jgi:uncharacterized membrane protein